MHLMCSFLFFFLFNTVPVEQSVSCPGVYRMPVALAMLSAGIQAGSEGRNRNCSLLDSLPKSLPSAREMHLQGKYMCVGIEGWCAYHVLVLNWKEKVVGIDY